MLHRRGGGEHGTKRQVSALYHNRQSPKAFGLIVSGLAVRRAGQQDLNEVGRHEGRESFRVFSRFFVWLWMFLLIMGGWTGAGTPRLAGRCFMSMKASIKVRKIHPRNFAHLLVQAQNFCSARTVSVVWLPADCERFSFQRTGESLRWNGAERVAYASCVHRLA